MTLPRVHVLPRENGGYRACAARVPGCVVIHRDAEVAAKLVKLAVLSLIEEEQQEAYNEDAS